MWMMWTATALAAPPFEDPAAAVRAFVQAGDARDTQQLDAVMHGDFRVFARMPDGWSVLDRSTYLTLIGDGKIGGVPRETVIESVLAAEELATVKGTLSSDAASFDSTWTVARVDGAWKIVQDATIFVPKGERREP